MNDRIRELALQVYGTQVTAQEIKFAELIVRECARIANEKEEGSPQYEKDMSIHWYILKHFGVGEE